MKNDGIQLALSTYTTYAHHDVFFENSPLRLLVDHSLIGTFGYQKGQKIESTDWYDFTVVWVVVLKHVVFLFNPETWGKWSNLTTFRHFCGQIIVGQHRFHDTRSLGLTHQDIEATTFRHWKMPLAPKRKLLNYCIYWMWSPPRDRDHQEYYMFIRRFKQNIHLPLLLGGGHTQCLYSLPCYFFFFQMWVVTFIAGLNETTIKDQSWLVSNIFLYG